MANNPIQIQTIIRAYTIQKNQMAGRISQANAQIQAKKQSIEKFEAYYYDYCTKLNARDQHTVATLSNSHHFIARIQKTLDQERAGLAPLEESLKKLMLEYNAFKQKIDGLTDHRNQLLKEKRIQRELKEDAIRNELSTERKAHARQMEKTL